MGGDDEIPDPTLDAFGYMYLADNETLPNSCEQIKGAGCLGGRHKTDESR